MEDIRRFFRCYGLAAICCVAPIIFGLVVMEHLSSQTLGIDVAHIAWRPNIIEPQANPKKEAIPQPAIAAKRVQPVAGEQNQPAAEEQTEASQDPSIQPLVIQLVGRQNLVAVSGFHIVACVAAIMVATYVLLQFFSSWTLIPIFLICASLAVLVGNADWRSEAVREKFVFSVFRLAALKETYVQKDASGVATRPEFAEHGVAQPVSKRFDAESLIKAAGRNTSIGLFAAGFVLFALFAVSKLPDDAPSPKELHDSAKYLRLLLYAASAAFVTSIISSKIYVDMPPRLVEAPSNAPLKAILNSLLSVWSATYSIVLVAGFGPAFAVWLLKRDKFRALKADERRRLLDDAGEKEDDALNILPMSTLTGLISVIAPLLASPAFEALQKILAAASGAK